MSATAAETTVITTAEEALAAAQALAGAIRPGSAERDRAGKAPRVELEQLARSGLLGITVPRELGGADVPLATVTEVSRILAVGDPTIAQIPQNHYYVAESVWLNGTPEQRELFAAGLLQGKRFGNALVERGTPTIMQINARLEPDPAGGYTLTARKYYCTGALTAQWVPVGVLDADENWCFAIVDRDAPGVEALEDWTSFGQRSTVSGSVVLTDVHVPEDRVLPHWRTHLKPSYFGAFGQIVHAAIDVGIAEAALEDGAEFVRNADPPVVRVGAGAGRRGAAHRPALRPDGDPPARGEGVPRRVGPPARRRARHPLRRGRARRAPRGGRGEGLRRRGRRRDRQRDLRARGRRLHRRRLRPRPPLAQRPRPHPPRPQPLEVRPFRQLGPAPGAPAGAGHPLTTPHDGEQDMTRSRSTRALTAAFLILGLVLAVGLSACGDDDEAD